MINLEELDRFTHQCEMDINLISIIGCVGIVVISAIAIGLMLCGVC